MAVRVKLPTILRRHTGGQGVLEAEGSTVAEVFENLEGRHPGITASLLDEHGALHRFVNVYVNDEDVRYLGALNTEVEEGDVLSILPAVAGGGAFLDTCLYTCYISCHEAGERSRAPAVARQGGGRPAA
jgi:molybdopterin synthase sulfur carrier subunit